jgi:H+/gluconate symporter-like permease
MALAKENSLLLGVAVAAGAWAVHANLTPSLADVRVAAPLDRDVAASERTATGLALGLVTAVSVLAQDATVFIIGGSAVIATAWAYRHANVVNPDTGKVGGGTPGSAAMPDADVPESDDSDVVDIDY